MKVVGKGELESTNFWSDWWVGEGALKETFPRLFRIRRQQELKISKMGFREKDGWNWVFEWRKDLRKRDVDMLNNLHAYLSRYKLNKEEHDGWSCIHSPKGIYSTSEAYKRIKDLKLAEDEQEDDKAFKILWNSLHQEK